MFQQMSESIGRGGCLRIWCAIAKKGGSSMRKALFRDGDQAAVASSSAGQARARATLMEGTPVTELRSAVTAFT